MQTFWLRFLIRFRVIAAVAAVASLGMSAVPMMHAQTPAEARATFLLNFAKFIEWPDSAFSGQTAPIAVHVLGDTEVAKALERLAKGKTANGREISVKAVSSTADVATAHIVFVGQANLAGPVIAEVGTRPVVTVGEEESFLSAGGLIRLFADGNKVLCAINTKVSAAAGLKLGDKLVRASSG
jgi:hypothetical protein